MNKTKVFQKELKREFYLSLNKANAKIVIVSQKR